MCVLYARLRYIINESALSALFSFRDQAKSKFDYVDRQWSILADAVVREKMEQEQGQKNKRTESLYSTPAGVGSQ